VEKLAKIGPKRQFSKNTRTVAPRIRRNSVYVAPPCEWILPQAVRGTVDSVTIVTLFVRYVINSFDQHIAYCEY